MVDKDGLREAQKLQQKTERMSLPLPMRGNASERKNSTKNSNGTCQ